MRRPSTVLLILSQIVLLSPAFAADAVPEEARRAFVQGSTVAKIAKTPEEQTVAVKHFEEAVRLAPGWGDAVYNLAVAQELAGQFGPAQGSLKAYLATNPGEKEAREAQDRIYALEAKAGLAASAVDPAKKAEEEKQALVRSLDGAKFMNEGRDYGGTLINRNVLEVRGATLVSIDYAIAGSADAGRSFTMTGPLNGLNAIVCCGEPGTYGGDPASRYVVDIAPDGRSATRQFYIPDGQMIEKIDYQRQ